MHIYRACAVDTRIINMASSMIGKPKMGLLFHSIAAGLYAFTFYCHESMLNLPNRATYGGRWKFLTILNLVRSLLIKLT